MALQPSLMPGPSTLAPFSIHSSQLDTRVPLQPLYYQSYPRAFRHTWGCASALAHQFPQLQSFQCFTSQFTVSRGWVDVYRQFDPALRPAKMAIGRTFALASFFLADAPSPALLRDLVAGVPISIARRIAASGA